jgi:hypothetical protein
MDLSTNRLINLLKTNTDLSEVFYLGNRFYQILGTAFMIASGLHIQQNALLTGLLMAYLPKGLLLIREMEVLVALMLD